MVYKDVMYIYLTRDERLEFGTRFGALHPRFQTSSRASTTVYSMRVIMKCIYFMLVMAVVLQYGDAFLLPTREGRVRPTRCLDLNGRRGAVTAAGRIAATPIDTAKSDRNTVS